MNGTPGLAGAVLIVDDEAEIRESLQTLLEMEGFAVETAATGEAGPPDLSAPAGEASAAPDDAPPPADD